MKLTHIMSKFFLTHIVSEAAKTFGKSQPTVTTLEEALLTFLGEALSRYEALRKWKANPMPIVTDGSDKYETPNL